MSGRRARWRIAEFFDGGAVRRAGVATLVGTVAMASLLLGAPAGAATSTTSSGPQHPRNWFGHANKATTTAPQQTSCPAPVGPTPNGTCPHLTYFGGPVLAHPQVESVLWGSGAYQPDVTGTTTPNMDGFFSTILHSPYLSWLDEYRPTSGSGMGTRLGYGDFLGRAQITPSTPDPSGSTIDDSAIRSELAAQISAGHLPAPSVDSNGVDETVYALFFPQGVTITMGGYNSVTGFCAYHGTITVNGVAAAYDVLPDVSHDAGGCGPGTNAQVLQSTESHELAETITDPNVGLVTGSSYAYPAGWGDNANGEIADICIYTAGYQTSIDGYTVQDLWSNAINGCIFTKATQPAPTGLTATGNSDGTVTLNWTAPTGTLAGYDVYASSTSTKIGSVIGSPAATATSWRTPVEPGGTIFSLVAANTDAVSSAPVAATRTLAVPAAIQFNPSHTGTMGGSQVLTAVGGGASTPVVFSVDPLSGIDGSTGKPVCTLGSDGVTLSYSGVGTCLVDANQAADNQYQAAQPVQASITVYASDGIGAASVSPAQVSVGATGRTLTFTYAPGEQVTSGALTLTVPSTWTVPSLSKTAAGYVTSTCGTVSISSRTVTVSKVTTVSPCAVVYGSRAGGGPGLKMPTTKGTATFPMSERSSPIGTLKPLAAAPVLQVWAAPTVTAVSPNSGSKAGGLTVTIMGTGFMPGDAVEFTALLNNAYGTSVTVVSSTEITVVTPAVKSTGTYNVVVISPGNVRSAQSSHDAFKYN